MAINIKNEETVQVVKRLAEKLQASYTAAIRVAVEAALQTPTKTIEQRKLQRVEQLVTDYQANLPKSHNMNTDILYDENGLFR